jgi:hypothetical protein
MNAIALPVIVVNTSRGIRKIVLFNLRFLWVSLDVAQSIRATSKIIAVAYNEWRHLQCGTVGVNLEQSGRMGWSGR